MLVGEIRRDFPLSRPQCYPATKCPHTIPKVRCVHLSFFLSCSSALFAHYGASQVLTLWRNGASLTLCPSLTSALFSMQWRGVSTTSADDPRDSAKIRGLLLFSLLSAVSCRLSAYVSPLECALTSKCRVLPVFNRSWPSVTPLECALTGFGVVSPLECALTKKGGGGAAWPNFEFRFSSFDQSRPPVRLRPHLPRGLLLCFLPLIT